MIEQFEQGVLPSKEEWQKSILKLKAKVVPATKEQVREALIAAVNKRIPKGKFGLFLSGGVDSSLLALLLKQAGANFVAVSVGIKGSKDLEFAEKIAKHLKLNWVSKVYSEEEMSALAKEVAKLVPVKDVVSIGVGCVEVAAANLGKENGVSLFFGGLGSEEVFAGYHEHALAKDINEACWNGMLNRLHDRDLTRDAALGAALKISVRCPFLDDEVIVKAMGIKGEEKIKGEHKKFILREIAESLGLPKEIAWRKKMAAQYGSGFDKAIERLARKTNKQKGVFVQSL